MDDGDEEEGQLTGPAGLLTVQILEAELPERVGVKGHSEGASRPYAAVVLTSHWCGSAVALTTNHEEDASSSDALNCVGSASIPNNLDAEPFKFQVCSLAQMV